MLQINIRKHEKSTTVALRGILEEADVQELIDQLEFLLKFDNKLELIFDCTRLVNTTPPVIDALYNVLLRLSYLRQITFCGMNDEVLRSVKRSRSIEFINTGGPYQEFLEQVNGKSPKEDKKDSSIEVKPIM